MHRIPDNPKHGSRLLGLISVGGEVGYSNIGQQTSLIQARFMRNDALKSVQAYRDPRQGMFWKASEYCPGLVDHYKSAPWRALLRGCFSSG